MTWEIEPRAGVEIYVSDTGHICLKQEDPDDMSGDSFIVLDPSIVPQVITNLQAALKEARPRA